LDTRGNDGGVEGDRLSDDARVDLDVTDLEPDSVAELVDISAGGKELGSFDFKIANWRQLGSAKCDEASAVPGVYVDMGKPLAWKMEPSA
jgi:hypothetical protein